MQNSVKIASTALLSFTNNLNAYMENSENVEYFTSNQHDCYNNKI